jgi:hypothetical protein
VHALRERFGAEHAGAANETSRAGALAGEVSQSGLVVSERQGAFYTDDFPDVGAIVYIVRAAPWEVPGFTPNRMRGPLNGMLDEIQREGSFRGTAHRLLVLAQRVA